VIGDDDDQRSVENPKFLQRSRRNQAVVRGRIFRERHRLTGTSTPSSAGLGTDRILGRYEIMNHGAVVEIAEPGGLHHRYERIAA